MQNTSAFDRYITNGQTLAAQRGLAWNLPIDSTGAIALEARWSLNAMLGVPPPPTLWLGSLGSDAAALEAFNARRRAEGKAAIAPFALSRHWQDIIKAVVLDYAFVRGGSPKHIVAQIVRPLLAIATVVGAVEPQELTASDVECALTILGPIQAGGKLRQCAENVVRQVFDQHGLSAFCPLLGGRQKAIRRRSSTPELRQELDDRKRSERLPEAAAFWEIVRIIFEEKPRSFFDCLRFEMIKLMVLLGLRGEEIASLPEDCLRWREYFDHRGRPTGENGGIGRSLRLRFFGEKQSLRTDQGPALFEAFVDIPPMYEAAVLDLVACVRLLTAPLRSRLRAQIEEGRIFPEFDENQAVCLLEMYPRLTGEPFVREDPQEDDLIDAYRQAFDIGVLAKIIARQGDNVRSSPLKLKTRAYYTRLPGFPTLLRANGTPHFGRIRYGDTAIRIGKLEAWLRVHRQTKLSDDAPARLADGSMFKPYERLFLAPKRALAEERNDRVCDVTRYAFVGRLVLADVSDSIAGNNRSVPTLFEKYGRTDGDRSLRVRSHDFRHLLNTELFRLRVSDAVITKRFNRKSVVQSYEYDHRSLFEDLDAMDIPEGLESQLTGRTKDVFRMISSARGAGPIADAFRRIQRDQGDEAAITYLSAEADGFHLTPYGACLNSFVAEPCPKNLECFGGCRHLHRMGVDSETTALRKLESRLETLLSSLEDHPGSDRAKSNARAHAMSRLDGVRRTLATDPGMPVFPDGPDLAKDLDRPFRGPFADPASP